MTAPGGGEPLKKITLLDNASTSYDLILDGGDEAINETWLAPNPITPGGPGKYGDFDPGFGYVEQRDFSRGFGGKDFTDDRSKFYRGKSVWSATPGKMFSQPKWYMAKGLDNTETNADPSNTAFHYEYGSATVNQYDWATPVTPANNMSVKYVYLWVMKVSASAAGSLYCRIWSDSGGAPNVVLGTSAANVVSTTIVDITEWYLVRFTFSSAVALTAATQYWVSLLSNTDIYSVVGTINASSGNSLTSKDNFVTTEYSNKPDMEYILQEAYALSECHPFILQQSMYVIKKIRDGSAPKLYINGDRGKATSSTSTTLVDTNMGLRGAWSTDQFAGAKIRIISGTGQLQLRTISANTNTGTITVDRAWGVNPDTTSQYIIYDINDFAELSGHGMTYFADVAVVNDVAYVAQGGTAIRRLHWDDTASPPAMAYAADGTNLANKLDVGKGYVYGAYNTTGAVFRAPIVSWGTNLTLENYEDNTGIDWFFTNCVVSGNKVYFFKCDSMWVADTDDIKSLIKYPINLGYHPDYTNGQAAAASEEFVYFNWQYALERVSGSVVDNLDPNSGEGMDTSYQGNITSISPHPAGMFFTVNAGRGRISGCYIFDGLSFHVACRPEISRFRMWDSMWQPILEGLPRLWISVEDTMLYQQYPENHTNPLKDNNVNLMHQWVLETATHDMGSSGLNKLFRDIDVVFADDFPTYASVFYQADSNIGSSTWVYAGWFQTSTDTLQLYDATLSQINALGNIKRIRLKFVVYSNTYANKPALDAYVIKGFGRTPTRKQWSLRVSVSKTIQNLGGGGDPETFMSWLDDKAENAEALYMTSEHSRLDKKTVIIIPRSLRTNWIDPINASFDAVAYLEIREA